MKTTKAQLEADKARLEAENAMLREKAQRWDRCTASFQEAFPHDPEELTEALSEAIRRVVEDDDFGKTDMAIANDLGRQLRVLGMLLEQIADCAENKRDNISFRLKVSHD